MRCQTNVSKVSEEGFIGSTYTKTGNVFTIASSLPLYQLSSWLIYPLGKLIILVIGESPTTLSIYLSLSVCSAKDGTLAPVFEKLDSVPNPNQIYYVI